MTLADLMPARLGRITRKQRHPQHRAVDALDRQIALRAGADLLIRGLRLQLEDQELRHAEVIARIDQLHAEVVDGLERQIEELERRLNRDVLAESVVTKTQELSLDEIRRHCVVPLHESPMATVDPGRVLPSWAVQNETTH